MKLDDCESAESHVFFDADALQSHLNQFSGKRSEEGLCLAPALGIASNGFVRIDLEGRTYRVDRTICLRQIHGAVISNGVIEASEDFPLGRYLFEIVGANTLKLENLAFECSKRANGIFAHAFLRLRIEDCTILHQLDYGIYASEKGNNHELEVIKCNILEFLWGDDGSSRGSSCIPNFRKAKNRRSTGVFLGQADNVVADCNINLCRVGIEVGMRANRIQGNHITAGGSDGNELFDGIRLNSHVKSSALIVNNYIDNCRIVICVDNRPVNRRNYVTITDNLFYRGFNHPAIGPEFNHIVIKPLVPRSILENIIVSDNQFYTQDEHLADAPERVIRPVGIDVSTLTDDVESPGIDPRRVRGAIMRNNVFTNAPPYFEVPMGSCLTQVIPAPSAPSCEFVADFAGHLSWGLIQSVSVTMVGRSTEAAFVPFISFIEGARVIVRTATAISAEFHVMVDVNNSYGGRWTHVTVN